MSGLSASDGGVWFWACWWPGCRAGGEGSVPGGAVVGGCTTPGLVEGRLSRELLLHGGDLTSVEPCFDLGRGAVLQRRMDPHMIEPVDPAERGEFKIIRTLPRSFPVDELCLVQAV